MKSFLFKVGDKVRCIHPDNRMTGTVIARGRYSKHAEKFNYTAGDRFYILEGGSEMEVVVEDFLRKA